MKCLYCKTKNPNNATHCLSCGSLLNERKTYLLFRIFSILGLISQVLSILISIILVIYSCVTTFFIPIGVGGIFNIRYYLLNIIPFIICINGLVLSILGFKSKKTIRCSIIGLILGVIELFNTFFLDIFIKVFVLLSALVGMILIMLFL